MIVTLHCKLVGIQEGLYTTLVFDNLNEIETSINKYLSCTKVPNWIYNDKLEINDIGYLHCEFVKAGEEYYCVKSGEFSPYKYNNCYFINFIKEREKINITEFKF